MTKSIVISGPPAVGKTTVAKGLASEFKLTYLSGGDILKEMAKEEGFDAVGDDWWDTENGMKFLSQRENNSEFDKKVDNKLIQLFKKGGMVITSYTLPWLVDDGIKIWLSGSHDSSSQRMQTRDNMTSKEAYEITKIRYDKNRALYKKLYDFDFGNDISVFDKIIDTDNLNATQVINIAKETVRELL
ncbi:cytidylate kinase family protein [Nitrosarchaeum sp. AC2]|uniref:cytidylate kinase family protein n=1 Tax=Nitrosarchaeum sp. AC2 TaxID=2259673 RepID=UPI0015CAB88B|nr:cytidylate kinase family protein [Nitrosarchaeum sp. AC2]QLH10453.1 cytidylate kinase [Nitrosarchaeum sp. AC2]